MTHDYQQKLLDLLPPVAYDVAAEAVQREMAFDAAALTTADRQSQRVTDALHPATAGTLLLDYERVYGLDYRGKTVQQRTADVLAKINATGGLSRRYFIELAAAHGVEIAIEEPQPFRAGVSRAGDKLWNSDAIYIWLVNVLAGDMKSHYFRAGDSAAGEPLVLFYEGSLETLFNRLKPAHTNVFFKQHN